MTTSSASRVTPKVELDFTTASLDSRITFARTTSATNPATFVNSSGVTSAATNNAPRFDYNPITLVCRGLLIEQSRANVCLQSSNFATSWNASGSATIGVDAINSPDGTQNADKLIEFTNTGQHAVLQAIAVSSATSYTVSIYAKKGERESIALRLIGTSTYAQAYFNLLAGTVTPSTGTASIVAMPNGWYRCIITGTSDSTTTNIYVNIGQTATSTSISSYTGDGVSGVYIWGAQLEAGAFVTSYIPTTTTSLTRNADVATITGTNFSNWWGKQALAEQRSQRSRPQSTELVHCFSLMMGRPTKSLRCVATRPTRSCTSWMAAHHRPRSTQARLQRTRPTV